jgi:hypothetical protein
VKAIAARFEHDAGTAQVDQQDGRGHSSMTSMPPA